MSRTATVRRTTGETDVEVRIDLDGTGVADATTGVGFFDHMLVLLARHSLVDISVTARGDLATGSHHTVEDVGIAFGEALDFALGDRSGVERYGSALVPMDEVLVQVAMDLSGRPFLAFDASLPATVIGGFETDLVAEFLRGMVNASRMTLHVRVLAAGGPHHVIEGVFKGVARALSASVAINYRVGGVPSSKGRL
ncbi:MAG: imidazoleglycerol-phosphate dehydratase HisB [Thermoleophilia bacterium]|nr:imidazoleglycerol-phosphate dehydratase HisB [Thermoleophilia bacterium]